MENIKNKTVLITGAATGIGYRYAESLLRNGAKSVAILDLPTSTGKDAAATLQQEFGKGRAVFVTCDVTKAAEFEDAVRQVVDLFNGIDIFINNAGFLDENFWEKTIEINYTALVRGSTFALNVMGKQNGARGGTLVNIASILGLKPLSAFPVYSGTKHAVIGYSRSLSELEFKTGVRVLVMCPGVTNTELVSEISKKSISLVDSDYITDLWNKYPVQKPENVANAMVELIHKGKNGDVWVSENGQPPFAINIPHYTNFAVPV